METTVGRKNFSYSAGGAKKASTSPQGPASLSAAAGGAAASSPGAPAADADEDNLLKKKPRQLRPTLRETHLLSEKGMWALYSSSLGLKIKGTSGHEAADMRAVMDAYKAWARELGFHMHPSDVLTRCADWSGKAVVKTTLARMRNELEVPRALAQANMEKRLKELRQKRLEQGGMDAAAAAAAIASQLSRGSFAAVTAEELEAIAGEMAEERQKDRKLILEELQAQLSAGKPSIEAYREITEQARLAAEAGAEERKKKNKEIASEGLFDLSGERRARQAGGEDGEDDDDDLDLLKPKAGKLGAGSSSSSRYPAAEEDSEEEEDFGLDDSRGGTKKSRLEGGLGLDQETGGKKKGDKEAGKGKLRREGGAAAGSADIVLSDSD